MNFKALQKTPIFFQMYGIDCLKQIESSHIMEESTWNDKSVGFIMNSHKPKGLGSGPGQIQSPLVVAQIPSRLKILVAIWQPVGIMDIRSSDGDQKWFSCH